MLAHIARLRTILLLLEQEEEKKRKQDALDRAKNTLREFSKKEKQRTEHMAYDEPFVSRID